MTVRSNWIIYCSEFLSAIRAIVDENLVPYIDTSQGVTSYNAVTPVSHFERKYKAVDMKLYQLRLALGAKDRAKVEALH